jgi:hypothetical protein
MNKIASQNLLNQSQRTSVAITFRRVERTLRNALRELGSRDRGILYRRSATLSDKQLREMQPHIEQAVREIDALSKELDLPTEVIDNRAALMGQLSVLWSDLQDSHAGPLRRYGDVAPGLSPVLDPHIDRVIEVVNTLLIIMQNGSDPQNGDGHKT